MLWKTGRRSQNIEDRRGLSVSRGIGGGGLGILLLVLASVFFDIDPRIVMQGTEILSGSSESQQTRIQPIPEGQEEAKEFTAVILADTEDAWKTIFSEQLNEDYKEPTLVLFSRAVQSACGFAQAAMGPFYCPRDQKVYIDLSFFEDLNKLGASGDFAQAYVIAHEIGHHIQTLLGISDKVIAESAHLNKRQQNALSVQQELQADCFAGVWANNAQRARNILERGDIEEGLNAASAMGDDRLQKRAQGYIVPESFTHGSSEQRVRWFKKGLVSGKISDCNTFKTNKL
ncbi:flagellar biosynthesis protein FlgM [Nitrosomonas sp. JL21]|uniref:KPN_02809 family neutral zinc metallopeptidase n=1 Tax=Nitrosomonas sp. JL21 TaxID=153949 RepID=UPI0013685073|nr:neutral zinc metallopeptidase [Nitrosomonas sp. JL21]MBL8498516.1 neutral zinc metallopeptidase [Nitrosomonas sp.]MXS78648.1 flagellar biosynthesis protein FlgM [Nitrosomonas sp. JL21]